MDLKGKVALVTGGARGLGRAVSLLLAEEGCHVAINYISVMQQEAEETRALVAAKGVQAITVEGDVTDEAQVQGMVRAVAEQLGPVDILVYSAGTTVHVPFPDLDGVSPEAWDRVMAVNVKGAFLCARAVVPMMRERGAGRIINVASSAGLTPSGSSIPYAVSKGSIIMLTKCLAKALAPDDILVNAVAPSMMRTSWWSEIPEETLRRQEQTLPLKRAALVEDVADGIMYMIKAESLTGHTMAIDSGVSMY